MFEVKNYIQFALNTYAIFHLCFKESRKETRKVKPDVMTSS